MRYNINKVEKEGLAFIYGIEMTDFEKVLITIDLAKGNVISPEMVAFKTGLGIDRVKRVAHTLRMAELILGCDEGYFSKLYGKKKESLRHLSILNEASREVFKTC